MTARKSKKPDTRRSHSKKENVFREYFKAAITGLASSEANCLGSEEDLRSRASSVVMYAEKIATLAALREVHSGSRS